MGNNIVHIGNKLVGFYGSKMWEKKGMKKIVKNKSYFFKKNKIAAINNRIPAHQPPKINAKIQKMIDVIKFNGIPNLSVIYPVLINTTTPSKIARIAPHRPANQFPGVIILRIP